MTNHIRVQKPSNDSDNTEMNLGHNTMPETIPTIPVSSDALPGKPTQKLHHLPGPKGHWLLGNLRPLGANPQPYLSELRKQYGDCFTFGFFRNQRSVIMIGPEANERVLMDRDNIFSSHWGWEVVLPFFGRNILVRDFEDHRRHRKMMTPLFKSESLALYLQQMRAPIETAIKALSGSVDVYRQTKTMALDIAVRVFAGITHSKANEWDRDLNTVLSNVMSQRIRLPGTKYSQALAARNRIRAKLHQEIAARRDRPKDDLFSQLINNRDEQNRVLSDQDIVDHMFGLLFAAHDTTASSLAVMLGLLAQHPELQDHARQECAELFEQSGSTYLRYADLAQLTFIDALFKETLRMFAPIQLLPRRNVSAFLFQGHQIPANTSLLLAPQVTHFDPNYFSQPQSFRPHRFLEDSVLPFSFVPFGKGSHMCLGMHFAHMEIKAVLYRLLLSRNLTWPENGTLDLEYLPIVRPKQTMRVMFEPIVRGTNNAIAI